MTLKNRISLRSKPSKGLLLNKPLIVMVAIVIVLLLFFSLFHAVHSPKRVAKKITTSPAEFKTVENATLKNLPNNYQDIKGIKRFIKQPGDSNPANKKTIKAPQNRLPKNNILQNTKNLSNALKSNVFFNGLTPQKQMQQTQSSHTTSQTNETTSAKTTKKSSFETQNMQSQKINFLQQDNTSDGVYNTHGLIKPVSKYEVQAGTIIPAVVITAINTSLPGVVIAQVTQNIYDTVTGKYLLIPKGSKVIGKYDSRIAYGQTRILIAFNRIIMPNGNSIQLNNFNGSDLAGTAGFNGNVNNHWMRVLGSATISTLLSVGTGVASNSYYNNNNYYPSPMQNALSAAGGSIASTGQQLAGKAMNIQPTITVPAGFEFNVIVNKDMVLELYKVQHATL